MTKVKIRINGETADLDMNYDPKTGSLFAPEGVRPVEDHEPSAQEAMNEAIDARNVAVALKYPLLGKPEKDRIAVHIMPSDESRRDRTTGLP